MTEQKKLFNETKIEKVKRLDLETAENIASIMVTMVDAWCKRIEVVGSIRRRRPEVHDIDFVVQPYEDERGSHWKNIKETVIVHMDGKTVLSGPEILRFFVPLEDGKHVQLDFYRAKPATYGIHKLVRTGSATHNIWLAKYAIRKGMRLRYSMGLMKDDEVIAGAEEKDVFEKLGLPFIEPKLREIVGGKPIWRTGTKVII